VEFDIKHRRDQLPASWTMRKFLGSAKIEQILMIHKDNNEMRVSFKIMTPFSECTV